MNNGFGILAVVCLVILLLVVEIGAVMLVAGFVASYLGWTGALWWAVALVVFLLINGVLGVLFR